MSGKERRHSSYFVSGPSVQRGQSRSVPQEPIEKVEQEQCVHGLPLGKFCLPCADERSERNRIDVV